MRGPMSQESPSHPTHCPAFSPGIPQLLVMSCSWRKDTHDDSKKSNSSSGSQMAVVHAGVLGPFQEKGCINLGSPRPRAFSLVPTQAPDPTRVRTPSTVTPGSREHRVCGVAPYGFHVASEPLLLPLGNPYGLPHASRSHSHQAGLPSTAGHPGSGLPHPEAWSGSYSPERTGNPSILGWPCPPRPG